MKGKPKFNLNDNVQFTLPEDNITYKGKIYIIDSYGTWDNPNDVSYDIMIDDWGPNHSKCLFKHITEKLVSKIEN